MPQPTPTPVDTAPPFQNEPWDFMPDDRLPEGEDE